MPSQRRMWERRRRCNVKSESHTASFHSKGHLPAGKMWVIRTCYHCRRRLALPKVPLIKTMPRKGWKCSKCKQRAGSNEGRDQGLARQIGRRIKSISPLPSPRTGIRIAWWGRNQVPRPDSRPSRPAKSVCVLRMREWTRDISLGESPH